VYGADLNWYDPTIDHEKEKKNRQIFSNRNEMYCQVQWVGYRENSTKTDDVTSIDMAEAVGEVQAMMQDLLVARLSC
jgi:cyclopropane fatty-acyl-phospholipid synthase-like methyltransferase